MHSIKKSKKRKVSSSLSCDDYLREAVEKIVSDDTPTSNVPLDIKQFCHYLQTELMELPNKETFKKAKRAILKVVYELQDE